MLLWPVVIYAETLFAFYCVERTAVYALTPKLFAQVGLVTPVVGIYRRCYPSLVFHLRVKIGLAIRDLFDAERLPDIVIRICDPPN